MYSKSDLQKVTLSDNPKSVAVISTDEEEVVDPHTESLDILNDLLVLDLHSLEMNDPAEDYVYLNSIEDLRPHWEAIHNDIKGHFGIKNTTSLLYMRGIRMENLELHVATLCKSCPTCQKFRRAIDRTVSSHTINSAPPPHEVTHFDVQQSLPLSTMGNQHVATFIDAFSRHVYLIPLADLTSESFLKAFLEFYCRFPFTTLITDNAPGIVGEAIEDLMKLLQSNHISIIPHKHSAAGIVERAHQETIRHLFALLYPLSDAEMKKWDMYLPVVESIINNAYHSSTGYTPNQLIYGSAATQANFLTTSQKSKLNTSNLNIFSRNLDATLQLLQQASVFFQDYHQLKKIDKAKLGPYQHHQYQNGDYVLLLDYNRLSKSRKKLGAKFRGPYQVIIDPSKQRTNTDIYEVRDLVDPDESETLLMHAERMKPFFVPDIPGKTQADTALKIAATDKNEDKVIEVLDHTNVPNHSLMDFQIKFEDGTISWHPASSVKFLDIVKQYVSNSPTFPSKWKKFYFVQTQNKRLKQKSKRFKDYVDLPTAVSAINQMFNKTALELF